MRGYIFIFFHCLECVICCARIFVFFVRACLYHCVVFSWRWINTLLLRAWRSPCGQSIAFRISILGLAGWLAMDDNLVPSAIRASRQCAWLIACFLCQNGWGSEILNPYSYRVIHRNFKVIHRKLKKKAGVLVPLSWSWNCHCKSRTDKHKSS